MLWLLVGGAAAVGAMLRYGTDQVVAARILAPRGMVFPLGTFLVNIVGSVLLARSWVAARMKHSVPDLADDPSAAASGDSPAARAAGQTTSRDGSSQ